MIDYSHQDIHVDKIIASLSTKNRVLAQQPTGAGKTHEFAKISKRFVENTDKSVIIIVHRRELLKQASKTIKKVSGITPRIIDSDTRLMIYSQVYVAMIESLKSRAHLAKNIGLVIIDECHMANFNKAHFMFPDAYIIGFTATPVSSSKKDPLINYYQDIIPGEQISSLIKAGCLAQNITRCPPEIVNVENIGRSGIDYKNKPLGEEFMKQRNVFNTLKNYEKFCAGKKTIVFNVNIEHSNMMNELFTLRGHKSKTLDSNCSEQERDEILQWYAETDDAVLHNVMIATVGFDEPSIRSVILNFATLSIVKYIQCCGRGGRAMPDKYFFDIIDMGGNYKRFGEWNDDRDWARMFWNPDKPGDGVPPTKVCPDCLGLLHTSKMTCDLLNEYGEVCGHEFPRKEEREEIPMDYAVVVTQGIDIDALIEKNSKKYEYYTFFDMCDQVVENMYKYNSVINDTVLTDSFQIYYNMCIEWYNKTLAWKPGYLKDISASAWHIKRARNHFSKKVKELKPNDRDKLIQERTVA